MKHTYVTLCFVLLCAVNVALSAESLDEWARTYDYKKDLASHMRNLRNARIPVSPNTVPFQMYDIIAKINQQPNGPISVDKVWSVQNSVFAAIKKQECTITYNSTYLSLEGDVRYTLYMGFSCTSPDQYIALCSDSNFYLNVIFSRLATHVSPSFGRIKKTELLGEVPAIPFDPPIPVSLPCPNYKNTPLKNWWADAMGGNSEGSMDCSYVDDSCAYNKGYGATLFLIDSGVTASHNEFTNMEGNRLTYRNHLSPLELGASSWKYDDYGHGTALASLTIGKTLGSVKDAKLISIKALFKNTTSGFDEVSTTAILSAVNQIIADVTSLGVNRTTPMLIYSGLNIAYEAKHKCYVFFTTSPSQAVAIRARDVDENSINKRTTVLTPGTPTPDPPTSSGYYKYDCAFHVVQAIKRVISFGVPYLVTSGNGFAYGPYAGFGVDMCFYAQWAATVTDCVPYYYFPLFMVNPVMSGSQLWNTGNRHKPIMIGGYQEDFDNAKWASFQMIDPTPNGTANFGDAGGAHYGSQWLGNRCVDYAAPATRFQTLPVLPGIKYGQWDDVFNGTFIYDDFGNYTPNHLGLSGTSYAIPLAAGSIISTMVQFWPTIKPVVLPDYTFGNRLINTVDANNVIGSGFHVSNDADIANLYSYYSWYLTESNTTASGSCANLADVYYTSDNYPSPVTLINTPYNRNLKMPKFQSRSPACQMTNPTPIPPSRN